MLFAAAVIVGAALVVTDYVRGYGFELVEEGEFECQTDDADETLHEELLRDSDLPKN